jgi:hypothetical protein
LYRLYRLIRLRGDSIKPEADWFSR